MTGDSGRRTGKPAAPLRAGPGRVVRGGGERRRHPDPPAEADPALLDADVRRELAGLGPVLAERVGRHLVAAALLLDTDPLAALAQAEAARSRAGRLAAVREACGLAAYAAGRYEDARAHLQAARRISGSPADLPLLADCERALGRPLEALRLAADPAGRRLDRAGQVELAIVASGARRDLGEPAAALAALDRAAREGEQVEPWTVRLWYAYAEALLAAGRPAEARRWFAAAAAIDDEEETDAGERVAALDDAAPAGEARVTAPRGGPNTPDDESSRSGLARE